MALNRATDHNWRTEHSGRGGSFILQSSISKNVVDIKLFLFIVIDINILLYRLKCFDSSLTMFSKAWGHFCFRSANGDNNSSVLIVPLRKWSVEKLNDLFASVCFIIYKENS